jgi:hypothetical protein
VKVEQSTIKYFYILRLYSLASKREYSHMNTYDSELALSIPETPAYRYKGVRNGRSSRLKL